MTKPVLHSMYLGRVIHAVHTKHVTARSDKTQQNRTNVGRTSICHATALFRCHRPCFSSATDFNNFRNTAASREETWEENVSKISSVVGTLASTKSRRLANNFVYCCMSPLRLFDVASLISSLRFAIEDNSPLLFEQDPEKRLSGSNLSWPGSTLFESVFKASRAMVFAFSSISRTDAFFVTLLLSTTPWSKTPAIPSLWRTDLIISWSSFLSISDSSSSSLTTPAPLVIWDVCVSAPVPILRLLLSSFKVNKSFKSFWEKSRRWRGSWSTLFESAVLKICRWYIFSSTLPVTISL